MQLHTRREHPAGVVTVTGALRAAPATGDIDLDDVTRVNWTAILTNHRRRAVENLVNISVWNGRDVHAARTVDGWERLLLTWHDMGVRSKINCSAGCVLEHKTTGELRYSHSSSNNATMFHVPRVVASDQELGSPYDDNCARDLEEILQQRPSTAWCLCLVTNITFYVYKLLGALQLCTTRVVPLRLRI